MREIELKGRVFGNTRQLLDAIAWATNRRGRNTWKSEGNVVNIITQYLRENKVALPGDDSLGGQHSQIRNVIKRLVKEGYAEVAPLKSGAQWNMFRFKDDVNLNGHMPRFIVSNPAPTTYDDAGSEGRMTTLAPVNVDIDALLPPGPRTPRYLEPNINAVLDIWCEKDPEGYAKWAETLIERLGAVYG